MKFMALWPLVLLILIPVVILMYLLKQKAVDTPVPSLFLWKEMYQNHKSDTPWEKLKKNILLILQIITIIVLIIALMGPYIRKEVNVSETVAILIDNSGSMCTKLDEDSTRLDSAKESAVNFVETLPSGTQITVISCSKDTTTLISNSVDKNAVISKIKGIKETPYIGSMTTGIMLCKTMLVSAPGLQVAVFTDGYVPLENLDGTIYNFCGDVENACVDFVRCSKRGERLFIMASVTNCSATRFSSDLNLYGDGEMLAIQNVTLEPYENKIIYFEDVAFDGSTLAAEINKKDALLLDNTAYGLSAKETGAEVLLYTAGNLYLERAVQLKDGVNITTTSDTSLDGFKTFEKENYDLYIFDGVMPEALDDNLPEHGNIMFINVPFEKYYHIVSETESASVKIDDSKYAKDIKGASFAFSSVNAMDYPTWATNLFNVKADNKTYSAGFIGETDLRKVCVLGFDIHDSDLALKYEFPVLVYSLISELTNTSSLSQKELSCGDPTTITSFSENGFTLTLPKKNVKKNFSDSVYTYKETDTPGIYIFNEGRETEESFVVNFPTAESKTVEIPEGQASEGTLSTIVDATEQGVFSYRPFIIVIILLLLIAEWIIFIRR